MGMMTGVRRFWSSRSGLDAERFGRWNEAVKRGEKEFFYERLQRAGLFRRNGVAAFSHASGRKKWLRARPGRGRREMGFGVAATLWVTVGVYVFPRRPCGEMGGMGAGLATLACRGGRPELEDCSKSENRVSLLGEHVRASICQAVRISSRRFRRHGKTAREKISPVFPRNPLISLISNERIQRKSKEIQHPETGVLNRNR